MEEYRAPTPATLKGARVLTTDEARDIWQKGAAAFVDVLPQAPRPANLGPDVVWRDKPRFDIPGSLWLPDTGYGALAPIMESVFSRRPSEGDLRRPGQGDRVLLSARLLDVMERRKARDRPSVIATSIGTRREPTAGPRQAFRSNAVSPSRGPDSDERSRQTDGGARPTVGACPAQRKAAGASGRTGTRRKSAAKEHFGRLERSLRFSARSPSASRRHNGQSDVDHRKRAGPNAAVAGLSLDAACPL